MTVFVFSLITPSRKSAHNRFQPGDRLRTSTLVACTTDPSANHLLSAAVVNRDVTALASLEAQGKIILLTADTVAVFNHGRFDSPFVNVEVQSGPYIGRDCDLLEEQLARGSR